MRRRGLIAFGAVLAAGVVLLVVLAVTRESPLIYTIGSGPAAPSAPLTAGEEACQGPLAPPAEAFDRVVLSLGTYGKPGQPVDVFVRDVKTRRVLSRGRLEGGYPDIAQAPEHSIPVTSVTPRAAIEVCARNAGTGKVAVYGATGLAHRTSIATVAGRPQPGIDLAVRLERGHPRTLLARLPDAFAHAAQFKPGWVGAWTFWVLAGLVFLAVPLLLARALSGALRDERA